jgi:hypothetical protein
MSAVIFATPWPQPFLLSILRFLTIVTKHSNLPKTSSTFKVMAENDILRIWFYVFGDPEFDTFSVEMAKNDDVETLQKTIYSTFIKKFTGLAYYELALWKVCLELDAFSFHNASLTTIWNGI